MYVDLLKHFIYANLYDKHFVYVSLKVKELFGFFNVTSVESTHQTKVSLSLVC